jgi:2-iminobutanoate/2-iminopropanoate deaminase
MKTICCVILACVFIGCGVDENKIRTVVKEEMASAAKHERVDDGYSVGPYSLGQKVGGFYFVSGQIAMKKEESVLDTTSIDAEVHQVMENLMAALRLAGYDSSHVISTTVYLADMKNYPVMNNIYGGYFDETNYPVRTTVGVTSLPRGAHLEISAIAYKPN